jgi:voltage-gated sodium channel
MWELIVVYPIAWIYFVSFIIVNAVVLLNMVIGVIVDVMAKESRDGFMPDADK